MTVIDGFADYLRTGAEGGSEVIQANRHCPLSLE
jgi:hypothetical protein